MSESREIKVGNKYHPCISVDCVKRIITEEKDGSFLQGFDKDEWEDAIELLDSYPYPFISTCDHVDDQGRCKGHPIQKQTE